MKHLVQSFGLFAIIICLPILVSGQSNGTSAPMVINQFDSVFFDLSQAATAGSKVEFPVYLRSDDQIFSLDFEFKYDHAMFDFDTIINLTSYMYMLTYYNPNDSVVRLTSYTLSQPYTADTPLVMVRMNVISGQLCSQSMSNLGSLLNGDACSYKVVECQFIGMSENPLESGMLVFPNPAQDRLTVSSPTGASITISNMLSGEVFVREEYAEAFAKEYNVTQLPAGIYLVRLASDGYQSVRKVAIR
jgi:hypothetical protein